MISSPPLPPDSISGSVVDDASATIADAEASKRSDVMKVDEDRFFPAPEKTRSVSVAVNTQALRSWVDQKSPCCCAASVAGALNTVLNIDRNQTADEPVVRKPFSTPRVLDVLFSLIQKQIRLRVRRFVREHGIVHTVKNLKVENSTVWPHWIDPKTYMGLTPLFRALWRHRGPYLFGNAEAEAPPLPPPSTLSSSSPTTTATVDIPHSKKKKKKKKKVTRSDWISAVRAALNASCDTHGAACFARLTKLFGDTSDIADHTKDEADEEDEDSEETDGEKNDAKEVGADKTRLSTFSASSIPKVPVAFEISLDDASGTKKKRKKSPKWLRDLLYILRKSRGMARVSRRDCARPSTAAFGNWGVVGAVKSINESIGSEIAVRARLVAGKKTLTKRRARSGKGKGSSRASTNYVMLTASDSSEIRARQWVSLRNIFETPRRCVIFHLKNHYALVFAMRQFVERDSASGNAPRVVRQLLTARKGQKPRDWIDWEEAHRTMTSWGGYKMIAVEAAHS
eukprot:g42.t1